MPRPGEATAPLNRPPDPIRTLSCLSVLKFRPPTHFLSLIFTLTPRRGAGEIRPVNLIRPPARKYAYVCVDFSAQPRITFVAYAPLRSSLTTGAAAVAGAAATAAGTSPRTARRWSSMLRDGTAAGAALGHLWTNRVRALRLPAVAAVALVAAVPAAAHGATLGPGCAPDRPAIAHRAGA